MKSSDQHKSDADRRLALLVEVRTALLDAGWSEDDLLRRLRAEIAPSDSPTTRPTEP